MRAQVRGVAPQLKRECAKPARRFWWLTFEYRFYPRRKEHCLIAFGVGTHQRHHQIKYLHSTLECIDQQSVVHPRRVDVPKLTFRDRNLPASRRALCESRFKGAIEVEVLRHQRLKLLAHLVRFDNLTRLLRHTQSENDQE